jgi:hypothetical protein
VIAHWPQYESPPAVPADWCRTCGDVGELYDPRRGLSPCPACAAEPAQAEPVEIYEAQQLDLF